MLSESDNVEELQQTLRTASKKKSVVQLEIISLRHEVLTKTEVLARIKEEIELLKIELQIQYENINKDQKQLSVIEMCKACEKTRVEAHLKSMKNYKEQYEDLFDKEKQVIDNQHREQERKEADNLNKKREQQKQIIKHNDEQIKEILGLEAECDALESECVVLKKRNTAIMLKLQRTLIEKEDARRNQIQKNTV